MGATDIVGYQCDGEIMCVQCGRDWADNLGIDVDETEVDENSIPYKSVNFSAIFGFEEMPPYGEYCGACSEEIAEPWLPSGYSVSQIEECEGENWYWHREGVSDNDVYPDAPVGPFNSRKEAVIDCGMEVGW